MSECLENRLKSNETLSDNIYYVNYLVNWTDGVSKVSQNGALVISHLNKNNFAF